MGTHTQPIALATASVNDLYCLIRAPSVSERASAPCPYHGDALCPHCATRLHLFLPALRLHYGAPQAVRAFAACWKRDRQDVQQSGGAQGGARLGSVPKGVALMIAGHMLVV